MRKIIYSTSLLIVLLGSIGLASHVVATEAPYTNIVVFGDSLSDEGYQDSNPDKTKSPLFTSPTAFQDALAPNAGSGHTWAYYLARLMNITPPTPNNLNPLIVSGYVSGTLRGTDYAAGGALVTGDGIGTDKYAPPSVTQQIEAYDLATQGNISPNNLYMVWGGANDFLKFFNNPSNFPVTQAQLDALADNAAANLFDSLAPLKPADPTHTIAVFTMPNLGLLPLDGVLEEKQPGINVLLQQASAEFNDRLTSLIKSRYPNVKIVDIGSIMNTVIDNHEHTYTFGSQSYTLLNTVAPACKLADLAHGQTAFNCIPPDMQFGAKTSQFMFEDLAHPTDITHQILAQYIYQELNK